MIARTLHDEQSKPWYMRPTFFVKVLWCIFSVVMFILAAAFSSKVNDQFFPKLLGKLSFNLLVVIAIFMLLVIVSSALIYFNVLPNLRNYNIYGLEILTSILLSICISFIAQRGTPGYRTRAILAVENYLFDDQNANEVAFKWFEEKYFKAGLTQKAKADIIYDYVDGRTEDMGSALLGCMLVWILFDALLLYLFIAQNDCYDSFKQDGGTTSEPLYSPIQNN